MLGENFKCVKTKDSAPKCPPSIISWARWTRLDRPCIILLQFVDSSDGEDEIDLVAPLLPIPANSPRSPVFGQGRLKQHSTDKPQRIASQDRPVLPGSSEEEIAVSRLFALIWPANDRQSEPPTLHKGGLDMHSGALTFMMLLFLSGVASAGTANESLPERLSGEKSIVAVVDDEKSIVAVVDDFVGTVAHDKRINGYVLKTDILHLKAKRSSRFTPALEGPANTEASMRLRRKTV